MNNLFDKIINVYLYDSVDGNPTDIISMPEVGIKPNIGIQASFRRSDKVFNPQVRLFNFYPSKSLNEYKKIRIEAGYNDSPDLSSFEGTVAIAYQESPSPDGVTLFSCFNADTSNVYNAIINIHITKGSSLDEVFTETINAIKDYSGIEWTLENSLESRTLQSQLDFTGTAKDFIAQLSRDYSFEYSYDWNKLIVYEPNKGRDSIDPIEINYLSSPPAQSASGITFTAPWIPALRPGMIIKIDPKYFKQSFGAANVNINSTLMCQTLDVNFNTVTNQNQMTVLALNTVEIPND
jgi:hypothetical protein